LQKIQLHDQKMKYNVDLINYLPQNEDVKAILVSVCVQHNNHPNGHAYLVFDAYQQCATTDQRTDYDERTYNCHGTRHHQELFVPWDTAINSSNLVIDVSYARNTGSYRNHGNLNWFEIKITGYIA
ncbi:unnamed protein product, partial [Didymodactylos carnosus]